jgi:hypothetical protein
VENPAREDRGAWDVDDGPQVLGRYGDCLAEDAANTTLHSSESYLSSIEHHQEKRTFGNSLILSQSLCMAVVQSATRHPCIGHMALLFWVRLVGA